MPDLPQAAIDAAAEWLHQTYCSRREMTPPFTDCANLPSHQRRAREVLEAAAPHIAAAERAKLQPAIDRVTHLAEAAQVKAVERAVTAERERCAWLAQRHALAADAGLNPINARAFRRIADLIRVNPEGDPS